MFSQTDRKRDDKITPELLLPCLFSVESEHDLINPVVNQPFRLAHATLWLSAAFHWLAPGSPRLIKALSAVLALHHFAKSASGSEGVR